jgi:hypothetical protein
MPKSNQLLYDVILKASRYKHSIKELGNNSENLNNSSDSDKIIRKSYGCLYKFSNIQILKPIVSNINRIIIYNNFANSFIFNTGYIYLM